MNVLSVAERLVAVADGAREIRADALDTGRDAIALRAGDAEVRALSVLAGHMGIREGDAIRDIADALVVLQTVAKVAHADLGTGNALVAALRDAGRDDLADALAAVVPTTQSNLERAS